MSLSFMIGSKSLPRFISSQIPRNNRTFFQEKTFTFSLDR